LGGCPSGGGGSMKSWSPQERLFVFMRISTEPFFFTIDFLSAIPALSNPEGLEGH
jgi:hypothetical protein